MKMTLGKFNNLDTIVHRIDSRIKLIALIVLLVSAFLSYGSASLARRASFFFSVP